MRPGGTVLSRMLRSTMSVAISRRCYRMANTVFAGMVLALGAAVLTATCISKIAMAPAATWRTVLIVALGLFGLGSISWALRLGLHGVMVDDGGITTLDGPLFTTVTHTPWSRIERFANGTYQDPAAPACGYGACAVLRAGGTVRLTGITAAAFGNHTRMRVDAIVEALNTELRAHQPEAAESNTDRVPGPRRALRTMAGPRRAEPPLP